MNNSLPRLIEGMVATLRSEIIPHLDGDFARGQAFGVIYMLNNIRLRTDWSPAFLGEQLAALAALAAALDGLGVDTKLIPETVQGSTDPRVLEALRDEGDRRVCCLMDWLEQQRVTLATDTVSALDAALFRYMNRQLKWELSTSAKPMFAEISSGNEQNNVD